MRVLRDWIAGKIYALAGNSAGWPEKIYRFAKWIEGVPYKPKATEPDGMQQANGDLPNVPREGIIR